MLQTAFETALKATGSPLIRKYLMAAKQKPIPTENSGYPMDVEGKDMEYVGVALQVYFLLDFTNLEMFPRNSGKSDPGISS